MKKHPYIASLLALATILAAGCASSGASSASRATYVPKADKPSNVSVTYANPDKFTDARSGFNSGTDDYYLDQLAEQFKKAASQYLKDGQKLEITVTDVDLAGDYVPRGGSANDVRIMRDIYRPRLALSYKVTGADGKVVKQGDSTPSDPYYLQNITTIDRNEPLFYDKALIDQWARSTLGGS